MHEWPEGRVIRGYQRTRFGQNTASVPECDVTHRCVPPELKVARADGVGPLRGCERTRFLIVSGLNARIWAERHGVTPHRSRCSG